ncbi:MAG: carboxylate--amine ligase [Eubacteriales bacterium]
MAKNFKPLLFAGDINVYSVARAFHEAYGIIPRAYGKFASFPCINSQILDYRFNNKADSAEIFLKLVTEYAQENNDSQILLIGCGDNYVELISRNIGNYPANVIAPYINIDLMHTLINKEIFYDICSKYNIDYPLTLVHRKSMGTNFELPFAPPYVIKPSNSINYWLHPFNTQKKAYIVNSRSELDTVISEIYESGYDDSIIIQEFIPGDDSYMRVLTTYSDKNNLTKMMCLGHVLLEEHTPHGIGNHAVIITEKNHAICNQIRSFLDNIGYTGWANFDMKYDERDGKLKVFEINTRQGRSNYYVTASGANVANYFVEDRILNHSLDFKIFDSPHLWRVVPKGVMFKYVNPLYKTELKDLIRSSSDSNPLFYEKDSAFIRKLRLLKMMLGHFYKYNKYMKV